MNVRLKAVSFLGSDLLLLLSPVVLLLAVGCKSRPLGPYTTPRITGQVLAADTHRPLPQVKVTRGSAHARRRTASPLKGGEVLMRKAPVQTDQEGRFALASERVLSVFRGATWDTVPLSFDLSGFLHFETNVPVSSATTSASGKPVLDLGDILLQPAPK